MTYTLWGDAPDSDECSVLLLVDGPALRPGETDTQFLLHAFEATGPDDAARQRNE